MKSLANIQTIGSEEPKKSDTSDSKVGAVNIGAGFPPVPSKMVKKIRDWECIEIGELLPNHLSRGMVLTVASSDEKQDKKSNHSQGDNGFNTSTCMWQFWHPPIEQGFQTYLPIRVSSLKPTWNTREMIGWATIAALGRQLQKICCGLRLMLHALWNKALVPHKAMQAVLLNHPHN